MNTALETPVFKTWKTIKLGTGLKTADDFRKAIKQARMNIGDLSWGNHILGMPTFTVATSVSGVELVVVSVAELGFKDGATRKDIYIRAKELGLDLCSPEVGPQLRLQYVDQEEGEWFIIAMEPIIGSSGHPHLFVVEHNFHGHWLDATAGGPEYVWRSDYFFIFVRRK